MKKTMILLAIASVAAMVACNKTQAVQETTSNGIAFRPFMNGMTRAAENTVATLEANGFYVLARYSSNQAAYFNDTHYTGSNAGGWSTLSPNYWPDESTTLDFYAYAPAASGQITGHDAADNYKTFTVTPSATVSEQVDLIFANAAGKSKAEDGDGVPLAFRHAESKVSIKLKNSNENISIWVNSVSMANIKGAGTFVFSAEEDSKLKFSDWTVTADPTSAYAQAITGDAQAAFTGATAALAGEPMVLVPQALFVGTQYPNMGDSHAFPGACIKVGLKIQNTAGQNWIVGGANEFIEVMWPLTALNWEPGKAYTYTVDLAGGGYYIADPDTTDTDYDLKPYIDPDLVIDFISVTVDDWAAQDEIPVANS